MNLRDSRMFLMTTIFLLIPSGDVVAKNKHCVVATNRIDGNFIAATKDSILHWSTTINGEPGKLLYVLPRTETTKDKYQGTFYYAESMTADCETFFMRLYDDDGNSAILIIRSTPQIPDAVCKNENHCNEIVDTIIEWHHKGASQPTHEKIHFKSISSARLQGLDASIPIREAEQIIAKTTYAVCSRAMANEHGFEHSDIFRQCLTSFSGQDAIDKPKK